MYDIDTLLNDRVALGRLLDEHRILTETIRECPALFAVYDADDQLMAWNKTYEDNYPEAFSIHRDRIDRKEMTYAEMVRSAVPADRPAIEADAEVAARVKAQRSGGTVVADRHYPGTGMTRVMKYSLPSGAVAGFAFDVNDMKLRELELAEARGVAEAAEARLIGAINVIPAAFAIYDPELRLVAFNDGFRDIHEGLADILKPGCSLETLLRAGVDKGIHSLATGREEDWLREQLDAHATSEPFSELDLPDGFHAQVYQNRTATGDLVFCRLDVSELKLSQNMLEQQADELRRVNAEVRRQALHDSLTGLPNRRYLDSHLSETLEQAAAARTRVTLMHLDLDRFKPINDTIGHSAGDRVLKTVADVLRKTVHNSPLGGGFSARVGGDEFVVVLEGGSRAAVGQLAQFIIDEISRPIRVEGHECRVGASIGIAIENGPEARPDRLMVDADFALYRAKALGRRRFVFFDEALRRNATDTRKLADEILRAIENKTFVPWYQPQFTAEHHALHGVEVLCRWQHPTGGVLGPETFLATANDLNIMADIDRIIFEKVDADLRHLQQKGVLIPRISFNVGAARLLDGDLFGQLTDIRSRGRQVAVELLESMSLDQLDADVSDAIGRLRAHGIQIEIDDFGSCRASISGLMAIKPDAMKIDQKIIGPITRSEQSRNMVTAIVQIGRALEVNVVAEGVETDAHVRIARELGCEILQGYALARPMPVELLSVFIGSEQWRKLSPIALTT